MSEEAATTVEASPLGAAAVKLLQRLIRVNTVNPPGNEGQIQEELAEMLVEAGFECELLADLPGRPNLLARLRGRSGGPVLAYLGHVDTVRADPDEWSRDPWCGEIHDGEVWGRGALDMKGQVAAEVAACVELAGSGWRPERGELLMVITADEEMGAAHGAQWLCERHPEKARCDLIVNEGGGAAFEFGGRRFFPLAVGERGVFRFQLRTRGRAGHASQPRIGDNALLKLAPLVARLGEQPEYESTPEGDALLAALLGDQATSNEQRATSSEQLANALARVQATNASLADILVEPMLGISVTPTKARASEKENVIPARAEVLVDCRVPPERDTEHVRSRVEALIGDGDYELEFVEHVVGNRSRPDTQLAEAISTWVATNDPGATVVPTVMAGFSDSHWFRRAFGAVAYGFCPQRTMSLLDSSPLVHGADERVPVADVELAARFFGELAPQVLG